MFEVFLHQSEVASTRLHWETPWLRPPFEVPTRAEDMQQLCWICLDGVNSLDGVNIRQPDSYQILTRFYIKTARLYQILARFYIKFQVVGRAALGAVWAPLRGGVCVREASKNVCNTFKLIGWLIGWPIGWIKINEVIEIGHQPYLASCSPSSGTVDWECVDLFGGCLCMRRAWEQISAAANHLWDISTKLKFGFNVPWKKNII